MTPTKDLN